MTALAPLRPLLARLTDLKRVRTPDAGGRSLAQRGFARAWADLAAGADPAGVAVRETAAAVAAVELAGVDAAVLRRAGLADWEAAAVLRKAIEVAGAPLDPGLRARLVAAVPDLFQQDGDRRPPGFVDLLAAQPRAGATHPTKPRLILEPPESHADHCLSVAVMAVVVLPWAGGADPAGAFLAGLAHHLHNARLPDAGFAGEELLGDHLKPVMDRFTAEALAELPEAVAARVKAACDDVLPYPDSPAAKAFHAADVFDRVLEMVHFDRVARFRVEQATGDLELVHPGPLRAFQNEVLVAAGLPT